MISYGANQLAIAAAAGKGDVSWLFEVDKNNSGTVDYYWSTKSKTFAAQAYTFKVIDFSEVTMTRGQAESGIQAPSEFDFSITNKNNTLLMTDFVGGNVTLKLVVKAGALEEIMREWNFDIVGVEPGYQKLYFRCKDWLQKYLVGDHPNTSLVSALFTEAAHKGNICVPALVGTPCIPVAPIIVNLVTNGNMELDANWANYLNPVSNARSSTQVQQGQYSRKFVVNPNTGGIQSDTFTTVDGKTYLLDCWIHTNMPLGQGIWYDIRKGDDSGFHGAAWFNTEPGDVWVHCQKTWDEGAATGGAGAYIVFYSIGGGGADITVYVDNVVVRTSYYLLGEKIALATDYDAEEVQTPSSWNSDRQQYSKSNYTFSYSHRTGEDGNDYAFGFFEIEDLDDDGTFDENILFQQGGGYLPANVVYDRNDTVTYTNPADALDWLLKNWGIPSARIDAVTLAAVKATYTGWGLTWNAGWWEHEPKRKVLAKLLLMCHTELIVRDKIYFKVHVKASQMTLDKSYITASKETGEGSFSYDLITSTNREDAAHVEYQEANEPLDDLKQLVVTTKAIANKVTDGVFDVITKTTPDVLVSGITKANPGVVTLNNIGPIENGTVIYFYDLTEMTELNGEYWIVRNVVGATFELQTTVGNSLDTSGYGAAETTGGACIDECDFTNWVEGDGWHPAVDGAGALTNKAHCDGTQAASTYLYEDVDLVIGRKYKVTYTVSNYSAGSVVALVGNWGFGAWKSANGTYVQTIQCAGNDRFHFAADATFVGDIDDVEVVLVTNMSSEIVPADFIQSSANALKIGRLAIQRIFMALASVSFKTKAKCLALECDDVITINHADYGGNYPVLIDSITIHRDISISIEATSFGDALDDWGDL